MSIETSAVLPSAIATDLRASILNQTDPPGASITESAVALRFGVARPTARLAIDKLVADGLLRREAHRAARVPVLSRDDIVDLFDNRALLEAAAVSALQSIPAAALVAHRALGASDNFAEHDIAFHRSLVAGQSSSRLTRMHSQLMGEIELCIGQVQAAQLLTPAQINHQHQKILDAIVLGDSVVAADLTRQHIVGSRDALLEHLDRTPHG